MATTKPAPAATEKAEIEPQGPGRSASYPAINLESAAARTKQFWDIESKYEAPLSSAYKHWGYSPKSSGARLVIAAMLNYGLMSDRGTKEQRMVRLTPLGIDLMMAPNEEFRQKKLKDAAKKPRIFADLLKQWSPENLPSNQTIAHYLVTQKGFNPSGTEACIKNFRDTIKYAHISSSDILPSGDPQDGVNTEQASAIKVGALVQWESGGMLQFPEARRVTFISEDGLFVFVDGEKTGLPVGEVTVMETKQPATPVQPANPPPIPPTNVKGPRAFRQDVYTLGDEGQVILQTPETMGQESYEELMDWMDLQMRKIARLNKIKLPEKKS